MSVPFKSILCGVEGDPSSTEAVRQAIALAAKGGKVHFLAIYTSFELGPDYTKEKLRASLDEAAKLAADAGVEATTEITDGRYAVEVLLSEGSKHDLLAIGTHNKSRAAGMVLGSTASEAAHNTAGPLIICRESPDGGGFPARILVASDGSDDSWAPARAAAEIAAACGAELELLHVEDGKHPDAAEVIDSQGAEIAEVVGGEPQVARRKGGAKDQILEAAGENRSSLIVCGRRGLTGIKSLGSVSERVVHEAGCSVLLVPADSDG